MLESLRPDPTFYPSPRIAMDGPAEWLAYTVLLSPDRSKPDALAVIDVDRGSANFFPNASPISEIAPDLTSAHWIRAATAEKPPHTARYKPANTVVEAKTPPRWRPLRASFP